jgi:hypothetical protein
MKLYKLIIVFVLFCGCTNNQNYHANKCIKRIDLYDFARFNISIIETILPIYLDKMQNNSGIVCSDKMIISKLNQTIKDYYLNDCFIDSSYSYKNTLVQSFKIKEFKYTLYWLILRHYPTDYINSIVLFYDNNSKQFFENTVDFNLHALYNFDSGGLIESNLKDAFKIVSPEIELIDFDKNGIKEFKFNGLYHNGTANGIESTIIGLSNNRIDTLNFVRRWVGPGTEPPN